MKRLHVAMVAVVLLCLGSLAHADVLRLGPGLTNLEMVTVGDLGNTADEHGYGGVGYQYSIGKYEVTAGQYCDFLNHKAKADSHGLYHTRMADPANLGCNIQRSGADGSYMYTVSADWANRPVNIVSFWDAVRFVNWLHNGQGDGDTETGAYTTNNEDNYMLRNPGAKWVLPSEDEWCKAGYYKGGGTNAGYWRLPTQSDSLPSNDITEPDGGNNVNYRLGVDDYTAGSPYWRTNVGEFENSESAYGTFDQGGNVMEWNETLVREGYIYRGLLGGQAWSNGHCLVREDWDIWNYIPSYEDEYTGFRVAYIEDGWQPVPEPSSMIALAAGLLSLVSLRRRRA